VHCDTSKGEPSRNPVADSVKNVTDLPIDPHILLYLSDHMSSQECFQLYNYLASTEYQNKMTLNRTLSYEDFMKRDSRIKQRRGEFPCFTFLKEWSFQVNSLPKGGLEKRKYAETLILVALHKVSRGDLHSWMEKVIRSAQHDEIKHLEKELYSRHSNQSKKQTKRRHSFEEEEAHSTMIAGFICFLFLAGMSLVIMTYICISIRLKPRDYIPLNSSDSKTNQGHKWENTPNRGYYNVLPVNDV